MTADQRQEVDDVLEGTWQQDNREYAAKAALAAGGDVVPSRR